MLHILIGLFIIIIMLSFYLNHFNVINIPSYSVTYNGRRIGSSQNDRIVMKNDRKNVKLKLNHLKQNVKLNYRQSTQSTQANSQNNPVIPQKKNSFLHTNHYVPSSLLHMYKTDDSQPAQLHSSIFQNSEYPVNWKVNLRGDTIDKKSFFREKSLNDT